MKIIANEYTYETGNIKVNVGDTVLLPYPSWHPDNGLGGGIKAVVTQLGSDYIGKCRVILGVVPSATVPTVPKVPTVPTIPTAPTAPKMPTLTVPANYAVRNVEAELVTVKEIEQLVRESSFLVIDDQAFRYTVDGWRELS